MRLFFLGIFPFIFSFHSFGFDFPGGDFLCRILDSKHKFLLSIPHPHFDSKDGKAAFLVAPEFEVFEEQVQPMKFEFDFTKTKGFRGVYGTVMVDPRIPSKNECFERLGSETSFDLFRTENLGLGGYSVRKEIWKKLSDDPKCQNPPVSPLKRVLFCDRVSTLDEPLPEFIFFPGYESLLTLTSGDFDQFRMNALVSDKLKVIRLNGQGRDLTFKGEIKEVKQTSPGFLRIYFKEGASLKRRRESREDPLIEYPVLELSIQENRDGTGEVRFLALDNVRKDYEFLLIGGFENLLHPFEDLLEGLQNFQ